MANQPLYTCLHSSPNLPRLAQWPHGSASAHPLDAVAVLITAGIGSGLAFRILEAGYRLNIPRMFAALALIAALGVLIFAVLSLVSHLALRRWHESALKREN